MSERWSQALLVVLLLGQLMLLVAQARGSYLERLLLGVVAPVGRSATAASGSVGDIVHSLRNNDSLRDEVEQLRSELESLHGELVRLHGIEEELDRLSRISGYTRLETERFFVADVVYVDHASWLQTLVLYNGTAHPRENQPVVTHQGLVGRIIVASGHYAKVQLLTDRSTSVSAMVVRTRRQGIVRGIGDGILELDYLPLQADVREGDRIVTAGIDGVFPRGIPIGRVLEVGPGGGLFHRITVAPAIDFAQLDQVYVLLQEALPSAVKREMSLETAP